MWIKLAQRNVKCESRRIFNSKFKFRRAIYFTYLEALGNALQRNGKEIYCGYIITDQILKDDWYIRKHCAKYGGISFTYGIFTPNQWELWWIFLFERLHFTLYFK